MNSKRYTYIKNYIMILFQNIISDVRDMDSFVNAIIDDVITDIEVTADWSNLAEDEIWVGDVIIAVRRVLFKKFGLD